MTKKTKLQFRVTFIFIPVFKHSLYLLDFHKIQLWVAVKPKSHLHKDEEQHLDIRQSIHVQNVECKACVPNNKSTNLIQHVELEGETHVFMRIFIPQQVPVHDIPLLSTNKTQQ